MTSLFAFQFLTVILLVFSILIKTTSSDNDDKYAVLKQTWCGDDNCYDLLGVAIENDFREIKHAYNNLSLKLHPDKNPNQSQADREFYVKVNKAWEILGSSAQRAAYDESLRIRSQWDSPKESAIFVFLLVYVMAVFIVLQYQKQAHADYRKAILERVEIRRYLRDVEKIDLDNGKTQNSKKTNRKRKPKRTKASKIKLDDKTKPCQMITDELIDKAMDKCNILVPGWKPVMPTWKTAAVDVSYFALWCVTESWFQVSWLIKYKLLKGSVSSSDLEHLCRNHFKKSRSEWNALSAKSRKALMQTPGPWKIKSQKKNK